MRRPASMGEPSELDKQRDIVFSAVPPGQVEHAFRFLSALPGCKVEYGNTADTLQVSYNLHDHTLEGLENSLAEKGFRLDHSMLHSIGRKIVYYCEDTLRHNLDTPEYPTKNNEREVFVRTHGQGIHGNQDDTPPELRDYK